MDHKTRKSEARTGPDWMGWVALYAILMIISATGA